MIRILPVVIFAFFAAVANAATVSKNLDIIITNGGGPITTVTFQNDSGSALPAGTPVSMGQGFAYGDIMPGTHPLIRDAATHTALAGQQWNEISTRRENGQDGSWRHAVWAAWLPSSLAAGATAQFEFIPVSGDYAQTSHQPLSALCSGPAAHDLKIHLTDVRNQDDSVRDSGDATFRVCDNIANVGRDAPRHLAAGNVMDEYVVSGLFVYTSGHKDPLLYTMCDVDIYTQASDGVSPGDVKWICHGLSPWMEVSQGSTGHAGNVGPAGFANDPQMVSYRVEIDDGASDVLDWHSLDATVTNSTAQILPLQDAFTNGGNCNYYAAYGNCLFLPSLTGNNIWYYGQGVRVTCSGGCLGGLTDGQLYYGFPASQASTGNVENRYVNLLLNPTGAQTATPNLTTSSAGTTTFSARIPHYHWMAWQTADASGLPNWSPVGTTSRVTRKLYPALTDAEKAYWEHTGLVVPLLLSGPGQPADNQLVHYQGGLSPYYEPMGMMNMIGTGAPGARSDIGIINEFAAQAFVSQSIGDWDNARTATYASTRDGFNLVLDEATARMPVLNNGPPVGPGGNGNGGSYVGLGVGTTNNQAHVPPGFVEGPLVSPLGKPTPFGGEIATGMVYTGLDHMPGFNGISYMLFGERQFLDIMQWRAEGDILQNEPGVGEPGQGHLRDNNAVFTDGQTYHYYGLMILTYQNRGSAWALRDIAYASTFGADDYPLEPTFAGNPERKYFNDILTENGNYYPLAETFFDGPNSVAVEGSIASPNCSRNDSGPYDEVFIRAYLQSTNFILATWLHEPIADYWAMKMQQGYEGVLGSRIYGGPSSYYGIEYVTNADIIDTGYNPTQNDGGIGPQLNGVDASEFGGYANFYASLLPGGQWAMNTGAYNFSQEGKLKFVTGWHQNGQAVDQVPGTKWRNIINADVANDTFYLQCDVDDHVAFPAQCPVAGGPFTGYTSGGVTIEPTAGYNIAYPKMRINYDPGPGQCYVSCNYVPYTQQAMNGLQVLGYDMSHSLADLDARSGIGQFNTETPQYNWDRTVTVAGLPAVVTYGNQFATISCAAAPGTVVSSLGLAHGNSASPGPWTIFKASDPAHFAISGNNLVTAGAIPCDKSYMVQVKTTQSGGREVIGEMHLHVNE